VLGNIPKIGEYIAQCNRLGIRVLPPSINESSSGFRAVVTSEGQRAIRFGLSALKNVGVSFIDAIVAERERGGAYTSLADFVQRVHADGNRRQIEALIKAGAFDGLAQRRSQMLAAYEKLVDSIAERSRNCIEGQLDLFSFSTDMNLGDVARESFEYPDLPEFSLRELLMQEKEASGMYFSGQLLDQYSRHVKALAPREIADILTKDTDGEYAVSERERLTIAGTVQKVTVKTTRKEERMAFITLVDRYAEMECLVFPKAYQAYAHLLCVDQALSICGTISIREEETPKLLVDKIEQLVDNDAYVDSPIDSEGANEQGKAALSSAAKRAQDRPSETGSVPPKLAQKLYLRLPDPDSILWKKACNLVEIFEGNVPVILYDTASASYHAMPHGIQLSEFVHRCLVNLLGAENVVVR
jgi:DNA polymerase-3 subunit alpha